MTLNPDQLVSEIKSRFDHATQKKLLKEKYQSKLTFAYGGGMWQAGPELLSTLMTCMGPFPVVLVDLYDTPVEVIPEVLFEQAKTRWQEQMNAWLVEHKELSRQR
jgi:hypothetical protein